jgi:DNA-binding XRE family transcriptional regulator
MRSRRTRDALEILTHVTGGDQKLRARIDRETFNARIALMVHEARSRAGLTQAQLADLVGTTQSAIARLEDADYRGHSLTMLRRIAAALDARLEVHLVPVRKRKPAA